jgi:hypothetical protein
MPTDWTNQASQRAEKNKGLETGKVFGGLFVLGQDYVTSGWKSVFLSFCLFFWFFFWFFLPFCLSFMGVNEFARLCLRISSYRYPKLSLLGLDRFASRIALMQRDFALKRNCAS